MNLHEPIIYNARQLHQLSDLPVCPKPEHPDQNLFRKVSFLKMVLPRFKPGATNARIVKR